MDRAEIIYDVEQRMLPFEKKDCPKCKGAGRKQNYPFMKCSTCGGSGKLIDVANAGVSAKIKEGLMSTLNSKNPKDKDQALAMLEEELSKYMVDATIQNFSITKDIAAPEIVSIVVQTLHPVPSHITLSFEMPYVR